MESPVGPVRDDLVAGIEVVVGLRRIADGTRGNGLDEVARNGIIE